MAWTNIDNALVSVGALPFATTIQALRDNPIAIANGDAGAPRIDPINAMEHQGAAGAIGTYAFARRSSGDVAFGATLAGSSLVTVGAFSAFSGGSDTLSTGAALSGTWRCMGTYDHTGTSGTATGSTLWLRIS
jgi:hypothetical protein